MGCQMKKILVAFLGVLFLSNIASASYIDKQLEEVEKNNKYSAVKKYVKTYNQYKNSEVKRIDNLKDPHLIVLSEYDTISDDLYNIKLQKDEKVYDKKIKPILAKNMNSINVEPAAVDFYKVYRISERLIRANNLDFVNWRVAIRKSEDVNASSFDGNYIRINTALYDSLFTNEDALAFVIAHEMAHQVLGHNQRLAELTRRIEKYERYVKKSTNVINRKLAYEELKRMELSADTEALMLLAKAGYSTEEAMEAMSLLSVLPNVRQFYMTHPLAKERIQNIKENIAIADPNWSNVGRENIYNSDVLLCKKSSDRVSIIIMKTEKSKEFYRPESLEQRVARIAYMSYLNGNMEDAIKYFAKLADLNNDYIPYLYISYANEYLYKQTNKSKYLKNAKTAILTAKDLNATESNVLKQIEDLNNL